MNRFSFFCTKESPVYYFLSRYITTFNTITNYQTGSIFVEKIEKTSLDTTNITEIGQNIENNVVSATTSNENKNEDFILKYNVILKAPHGNYEINFEDTILYIEHAITDTIVGTKDRAIKYESMKITGPCKEVLLNFVEEARKYCTPPPLKQAKNYITIRQFDISTHKWIQLSQLKKRNINSVFLDENIIEDLKEDIKKFIDSESIYDMYGIPYKRNYLLYGMPGTGKTSLIFAIASYLDMNVSIFSFTPGIDDTLFMKCVNSIPNNSILVLEDIDGVFTNRTKDYNNNSMISFSGVLNTLDGMGRKDKLLTFMTTNYKEQLDGALLRPGRVDYKIEFGYTTQYQISKMYDLFIKTTTHKKTFLNYVKSKNITTCILQKFLFEYRECENIMDHIDTFDMYIESYNNNGKNLYI